MKYYELNYLISSELSGEEAEEFQSKIASKILEEEGILGEENTVLRKKLAYPIKKSVLKTPQTQAYLAVLSFKLNPEKLANLEKKLKSENQILRYLILVKKVSRIIPKKIRAAEFIAPKKPMETREEKKVELKEIEKKLEEILKE